MPRGTPRVSPPLCAQFLCWRKTLGEYPECQSRYCFPYLPVYYREGWPKAMKACKTPVCYVAKNTNLTHCHSAPTQLKLQEKGGTVTRPLQVLHTLQWHHPGGRALGNWL